jgi:hypothetical protein
MSQLVKMLGQSLYTTPLLLEQKTKKSPLCYAANRSKNRQCRRFRRLFQRTKPPTERKLGNLDVLGTTEPLLSTAIGKITGTGKMLKQSPEKRIKLFYRR